MPDIEIRCALSDADFDAARALSFAWADWHWEAYPEHRHVIEKVFEPVAYKRAVADLHVTHARPKGAILLAKLDGQPAGCVMYQEMEPGVAEVKRLYVDPDCRGHGLGSSLLMEMFRCMIADGYVTVRFSSARFLTHARRLYESMGFIDIPQPDGFPEHLRDTVYFMERRLQAPRP